MKIALVHDDFLQAGGAESLFATIAAIWPKAPIYTSLVDWQKLPTGISRERIRTSFLQRIPFAAKFYKVLLPLYPLAFESFDFGNYDLVISSTTRFAKGIITKPGTCHLCYINSVPRFLWDEQIQADYLPYWLGNLVKPVIRWLQKWDKIAAQRVDFYIANSQNVAEKINQIYHRKSEVIYPFVNFQLFKPAKIHNWSLRNQNYWLIISRLVKWKKIEIAIEAAKTLGINLKIVGTGPDEARLKKLAAVNQIEFREKVDLKTLIELYQNAQGLIVTQEEDFGIAAVEAQACGIPVIAYGVGGLKEIIIAGQTGLFFPEQTATALKDAISVASSIKWSVLACRRNAQKFNKAAFVHNLVRKVADYVKQA